MTTNTVLIFHEGKLEASEDLQRSLGLREGARLRLVSATDREVVLEREPGDEPMSPAEFIAGWASLYGTLEDKLDTSELRRQEHELERKSDARKLF